METENTIQIKVVINAPIDKIWNYWTEPVHIKNWNNASPDWHTPRAENDLRPGGKFNTRMEAKDGSSGFDFSGIYDTVLRNKTISYTMEDGRKVHIDFMDKNGIVLITETFDPESENPIDMQRNGWQAILDNFKKYVEEK